MSVSVKDRETDQDAQVDDERTSASETKTESTDAVSVTTVDEADEAVTQSAKVSKKKKSKKARRGFWFRVLNLFDLRELLPKGVTGSRMLHLIGVGFMRIAILVLDLIVIAVTVLRVIPALGVALYGTLVADSDLNWQGSVVYWLAPFAFAVLLLLYGEIALLRGLWRSYSRHLRRAAARAKAVVDAADAAEADVEGGADATVPTAETKSKASTKRRATKSHPRSKRRR